MNGQLGIPVDLSPIQAERQIQTVIKNFWIHGLVIETIEGEVKYVVYQDETGESEDEQADEDDDHRRRRGGGRRSAATDTK